MSRRSALLERPNVLPLDEPLRPEFDRIHPDDAAWLARLLAPEAPATPDGVDASGAEGGTEAAGHRWVRGNAVFDHGRDRVVEYRCADCGLTEYVGRASELPRSPSCD